jgi:hypothetical protein
MEHNIVSADQLPAPATTPCVCGSQQSVGTMFTARDHATHWRPDRTCSYCGSIDPDFLLEYLERGQATLEKATGKDYKWYAYATGGAVFYQNYRPTAGPEFVTRTTTTAKLYTWHLSAEQAKRINQLLLAQRMGQAND